MAELLTLQEAADFLRLKVSSLRNMVHGKKIPFTKPTGKVLFRKSDLQELIEKNSSVPNAGKKEVGND
jgi:excisionase family DNA binding protein